MQSKPVRTYLDPDSVGPLPRAVVADDSDALASARTIVRLPAAPTQEINSDDVLEVVDPNRRPSSLTPVGWDTDGVLLPRRRLTRYVVGAVAAAAALGVLALVKGLSASPAPLTATATATAGLAPPTSAAPPTIIAVAPPAAPAPSADATVGTLRIDGSVEGHKVYVDGVALTAPVAMLRCGPHDLAVGSPAHPRTIDVPCGGEVTVFR